MYEFPVQIKVCVAWFPVRTKVYVVFPVRTKVYAVWFPVPTKVYGGFLSLLRYMWVDSCPC